MRPSPGDLVGGKYRVVRLIGDGGMGSVYEARHEVLGTAVALKFLHNELARRPGLAQRFSQEARVSANVQSPHVTRVTDVDTTPDGTPYLVMELLNGESLQQLLDRRGKLPVDQAVDFALQTLSGLESAHAIGVVHRDLKPDNVFVTPSSGGPLLKLIDFGIAKIRASNEFNRGLTRAGALMGTPEYMAPEQLYSAAEVDHRADIFSLGVMLFEMLSGLRPSDGDDAQSIVGKVLAGDVRQLGELEPELAPGLVELVHRAIAADRNERFASAHDMRMALAAFAGELSHAGRLAAEAHPALVGAALLPSMVLDEPLATRDTDDDAPPQSQVARTLPPEDDAAGKGATEQAPPLDVSVRRATEQAPPIVIRPATTGAGTWPGPPPARRRGPRSLGALIAVLFGLLVTGGIVAGIVWYRRSEADSNVNLGAAPPLTTLTPLAEAGAPPTTTTPTTTITPVIPTPPAPMTPTPPATTAQPRPPTTNPPTPVDAGAPSVPTFPPFVLPSSLPSTLPPLPSGFPTAIPTSFPTTLPPLFPSPGSAPDGG